MISGEMLVDEWIELITVWLSIWVDDTCKRIMDYERKWHMMSANLKLLLVSISWPNNEQFL